MPVIREGEGYLRRLRAGDESAYAELVEAYDKVLQGVARRVLRDPEEARDAVQDVYLSFLRSIEHFDARAPLMPWLCRITVNASISRLRRRPPLVPEAWCGPARPEAAERAHEVRDLVRRCLAALPPGYRSVVHLREIQGHDTRAAARLLGISPNAVKIRLHRARRAMRAMLETQQTGRPA